MSGTLPASFAGSIRFETERGEKTALENDTEIRIKVLERKACRKTAVNICKMRVPLHVTAVICRDRRVSVPTDVFASD